jgi:two-component system response regulator ChvI
MDGELHLDAGARRAHWRGQPVPLTLGEYAIVERLCSECDRDVSYRALYDVVRGDGFVAGTGDNGYRVNVRAFVKRIRQKFRKVDPEFDAIENFPGFGYRWRRTAAARASGAESG